MAEVVRRAGKAAADLNAEDVSRQVLRYTLAYHVHTELENGADGTSHTDYLVDAHSGAILEHVEHPPHHRRHRHRQQPVFRHGLPATPLQRQPPTTCATRPAASADLRRQRGHQHATTPPPHRHRHPLHRCRQHLGRWRQLRRRGQLHHRRQRPDRGRGRSLRHGPQAYDYYKNVFGRNGIDGTGTATYSRVHYSNSYDNAFWSDSCFCMTYGDGSTFTHRSTSLDVAGHEMSHGVCARTANLTYSRRVRRPERGQLRHLRHHGRVLRPRRLGVRPSATPAATGPSASSWPPTPCAGCTSPAWTAPAPTPGPPPSAAWTCTTPAAP